MKSRLTHRREAYRLWFEYLRVAHASKDPKVKEALKQRSDFYTPWGDVVTIKFDEWWKTHGRLFEEAHSVRRLSPGEAPSNPNSLVVEVPLNQSPTELAQHVKAIVQEAFGAQTPTSKKSKKLSFSMYLLTQGAEPKLRAVREMLTVYRDVYLKRPDLRGKKLLDATHLFYVGRKSKRWAKVPTPLLSDSDGDTIRSMRNLRRYITKAERIVRNVANGEFPGEY
jgi:hypothetical protein